MNISFWAPLSCATCVVTIEAAGKVKPFQRQHGREGEKKKNGRVFRPAVKALKKDCARTD